jgi:hypothetical protein
LDRAQEQAQMEAAESFDVNAGIHGNWKIENAKSKLSQFMQMNKIQADFRYTPVGPDHARLLTFNYIFPNHSFKPTQHETLDGIKSKEDFINITNKVMLINSKLFRTPCFVGFNKKEEKQRFYTFQRL